MDMLITLDYELYNGFCSGSVQNCLITPCDELQLVLDKYGVKCTFFVDTVYLNRLFSLKVQFPELQRDWDLIYSQLSKLSKKGHELQLHLHPQWYRATYSNGKWSSVFSDYKLSDMSKEEVDDMFDAGVNILRTITGKKPIAFRAGAYSIQTLSNLDYYFTRHGLIIDSSVNRGMKSITRQYQWYDYTDIPPVYSYRFESDVTKEVMDGPFYEVSIPTYKVPFFVNLKNLIRSHKKLASYRKWGDGTGSIGKLEGNKVTLLRKVLGYFKPSRVVAGIDSLNAVNLSWIFKKEQKLNNTYLLIMGHPKALTPYSLSQLEFFLNKNKDELCSIWISELVNR